LQGVPATQIAVFEWYNDLVHLLSHEEFMSSPEFLNLDPVIQQQFQMHRQMHIINIMVKAGQTAEANPEGNVEGENQFTDASNPDGSGAAGSPEGAPTSQPAAGTGGTPPGELGAPAAAGQ
jgi:hypothetical protein